MSFIELFGSMLALDFVFLIDMIMNNLFWVFGFLAAGYVFSSGKRSAIVGLFFASLVLASMDMFSLVHFTIYTAYGLMMLYLVRVALLLFLENIEGGSRLIPLFWVLSFFFVIAIVAGGF